MTNKATDHEFLYVFGNFIMTWNHVENYGRDILFTLAGQSVFTSLMTKHLGNASITDILVTASTWKPEAAEHFQHFAKMMDTIRAFRNYYVHSIMAVGQNSEFGAVGLILAVEARNKFKLSEKALKLSELQELLTHCEEARQYATDINKILENGVKAERVESFNALKKPMMPKPLAKKYRESGTPAAAYRF